MGALLACGATFATGAMAADLPARVEAPAPYIAAIPVFTWTGFYIGVNAGAAFDNNTDPTFTPSAGLPGSPSLNPAVGANNTDFTGGVEAGYNMQVNSFVFGVEGDIDYLGGNNNINGTFNSPAFYHPLFPSYTIAGATTNHLFGTIRGRLGFAVDRALFYVTGGAAFGGNQAPTSVTFNIEPPFGQIPAYTFNSQNTSNNEIGAVLGGGIEYAFTNNWSAKVEYLHTFYGKKNVVYANGVSFGGVPQTFTLSGDSLDTNIVRVGLNYKF